MTSGGPQQGWPGQPDPGQGQQAGGPGYGQPPQYGQQPGWQQGPAASSPQPHDPAQYQQPGQYQQYPQQGGGYGQAPQYGQPPQYGQQPGYQQPAGQYPGYQQPHQQPHQQPYQQPYQQGQGYPGPQQGGPAAPPPQNGQRKNNTPVIITVIAVVVALAAAGLVYLFASKDSETAGGQAQPKDAVVNLLNSVTDEDPIGIADQLDPTEAQLFADMTGDVLDQLKRLGVVKQDVQADKVTGLAITTKDLTYADSPIAINDHLQIVELTGGTITLQTGIGQVPYSQKMIDAFPSLGEVSAPQTKTIDIAKQVAQSGHPIRIATVNRDGQWYPSLFYTIADNWAYQTHGADYTLDPIGNTGGDTPEAAMNTFLEAAQSGDPRALISVLSPEEMGVLHDYGNMIIGSDAAGAAGDLAGESGLDQAKITDLSWSVSDVTGGKKVSLKTITIQTPGGDFSIQRDPAAGSLKVSVPGQGTINMNAENIDTWLAQLMGEGAGQIPPQVKDIIKREFSQVIGLGVVMVQGDDGKWYVSPLRTFSDVMVSLLKGLEAGDIDYLLSLANHG